ncbi:MAG TPA: DUF2252 family protein [Stellaceae bacterium]
MIDDIGPQKTRTATSPGGAAAPAETAAAANAAAALPAGVPPIQTATIDYETWLGRHVDIIAADLQHKHRLMGGGAFAFLRATFYRWMQFWPELCPDLDRAPCVLAVGDIHIENFGTWRDIEGRLVWGVNDFDEACDLPYTLDLVRLAASALLAQREGAIGSSAEDVCGMILGGYRRGLETDGRPFVLEEKRGWLRTLAINELRDPVRFWDKLNGLPDKPLAVPHKVRRALRRNMPDDGLRITVRHRVAGVGSLGRPRFVALARWHGAHVAREAKAVAPSAAVWAAGTRGDRMKDDIRYNDILDLAVRCPDPILRLKDDWVIRRLAPDCSKIDIGALPKKREERKLLRAMGWEIANIHLGSRRAMKQVRRDLDERPAAWLTEAAHRMADAVQADWKVWRGEAGAQPPPEPENTGRVTK